MAGTIDEKREDGSEASKKMSLEKEGGSDDPNAVGTRGPRGERPRGEGEERTGRRRGRVQDSALVTDDIRAPCGGSAQQAADRATRGEGGQGDQVHPLSTFS